VSWGLSEAQKELDKVHSSFGKKLMVILNCAACGFPEMELGRQQGSKCIGQIVKFWYWIVHLDIDDLANNATNDNRVI
jgi:hypothetical protein